MCLTQPKKVIKIKENQAQVESAAGQGWVKTHLVKSVKKGDWVLVQTGLAIKKIPRNEAREIIELLENQPVIDLSKLGGRFKKIIKATKTRKLTKQEIVYLLKTAGAEKEALFSEANVVRKMYIKDFICIHGIIEFSNYCRNDCSYCGLRKQNNEIKRYRMSIKEIVNTAKNAVNQKGYKLLVLQSGEDCFYTNDALVEIIKKIKKECRVFIFMSVGERGYDCYRKMKQAGASGALLRFETANPKLFKKIHPAGKNFKNRFLHLKFLKELGYFIATGSLIGLPGQTLEDLARDILAIKKWAHMASMGPFVPCDNTPMASNKASGVELNLKMIAILRLIMKSVRIPSTSALETLAGENGRKRALRAGANSLMFNLTPARFRHLYKIYPNKFYQKENTWEKYGLFKYEESYKMLEYRMARELKI